MLGKSWSNAVMPECRRLKSRVGINGGDGEGVSGEGHRMRKGQQAGRSVMYFRGQ